MITTTNFGLKKYEGSDKLNPLTFDAVNMDTLDSALQAVKEGAILPATEVKTGTVHAITRDNSNCNIFKFTATSAWTTGDSMTVDGSNCSVVAVNGMEPNTGSYAIGSQVIGIKAGNVVTLLVGGSSGGDAETLEGHGADYFASATDLSTVEATANSAGTVASTCATALANKKLWSGTLAQYNAIATKDSNTIYFCI